MHAGGTVLQQFGGPGVGSEGIWLVLGTILMLLGTVYFIARGWDVEETRQKEFYVIPS